MCLHYVIHFEHATRDATAFRSLVCSDAFSHEVAEVAETAGIAKQKEVRMAVRFPLCASDHFILFYFRSDSDLTSQLAATRSELATLQERYDALHADRDRLVQTLSENIKKYKRFKRWIFTNKDKIPPRPTERDEMPPCSWGSSTPGLQQQSVIKMLETPMTPMSLCPLFLCNAPFANTHSEPRPNRTGAISSPTKAASPRKSPLSPNVSILNTPRCVSQAFLISFRPLIPAQCSKIRILSEGSPYTRHLKRKHDENGDTSVEEMSQTQEDSQGSFYAFTHHAYSTIPSTSL